MIEYVKTILQKVSFSTYLFERELRKGLRLILPTEVEEFKNWCYEMFGKVHQSILNRYFQPAI
ncbi:MAG TPA: hypothetical protein DEQ87_11970 [Algoriphagus sp.]|jgi:hypothetical protein|uniref:Uncharacterized protein n=1 Tax=Algoriphagus ornithinivorans TaxID=226506 RepID=A0A1I5FS42_9BACT|nr:MULTISPECIES: hypothetical protein [unclassified Algoriphagus]SFO26628.1 hypothetical protein SAMN04488519_10530 [Algoriphagus ornithinivorans]MAL14606.1 hypothetical protein [Algoriphagus sp.]MAN87636.1 hypothetical protein [Algoriphagus sp.]HAH37952.1 hypothetical protein [Algoriphagus sp.]HAS59956.1 hypothetical protein [Algoriphagus sp.]